LHVAAAFAGLYDDVTTDTNAVRAPRRAAHAVTSPWQSPAGRTL